MNQSEVHKAALEWMEDVTNFKKAIDDKLEPYQKYLKKDKQATLNDKIIEDLEELAKSITKVANQIHKDIYEMNQTAAGVAGAQDRGKIENMQVLLRTLKAANEKRKEK